MQRNTVCHHDVRPVRDVHLKAVMAALRKGTASKQADAISNIAEEAVISQRDRPENV